MDTGRLVCFLNCSRVHGGLGSSTHQRVLSALCIAAFVGTGINTCLGTGINTCLKEVQPSPLLLWGSPLW